MRMFYSFLQLLTRGVIDVQKEHIEGNVKICARCKLMDPNINCMCLDCKKTVYCSQNCLKKNYLLHKKLCVMYTENYPVIKSFMEQMKENYGFVKGAEDRKKLRKK
jgi:hypothetical protein